VQSLLQRIATDPEARNEQSFNELMQLLLDNPKEYARYLKPDGSPDFAKIEAAVAAMAKRAGTTCDWNPSEYGGALRGALSLRLMLERSGSMTAYDDRSGSGNFKRAVSEMITRFPSADTGAGSILIVNDNLYPYPGTFESFVQDRDIFSSTSSLGNPAYTDFARIFAHALSDTVPERITVLVTDLIYSPSGTENVTAEKIFNEESALTTSLFHKHLDKSMIIVRLSADYRGVYYPFDSAAAFNYSGQRPYYMVITGSAAAMSRLRSAPQYAGFVDFASLPGYEHQYFFNRHSLPLTWWSLMPRSNPSQGEYRLSGGSSDTGTHSLKGARAASGSNVITFSVALDMKNIPADPEYLLDPANYKIESEAPVQIVAIRPVGADMSNPRTRRYLSQASHIMELRIDSKTPPSAIKVSLLNHLPHWVKKYNATSDRNPAAPRFASSTFGLLPFLQGVYQAYYGTAEVPEFTSFTVIFEN